MNMSYETKPAYREKKPLTAEYLAKWDAYQKLKAERISRMDCECSALTLIEPTATAYRERIEKLSKI